jgi:hypothetical protein
MFAMIKKYNILIMEFGKIAGGYLQPNNVGRNVTLRRFRVTIAATKKKYVRNILSVCLWP